MKHVRFRLGLVLAAVGLLVPGPLARPLAAEESYLEFLRGLRQRGYGDTAVEYLKILEKNPSLPAEIREVLDLEMANTMWAAATQAYNDEESQKLRKSAEEYLEKFQKEKPQHPAIAEAMFTWGTASFERGVQLVRTGKATADKVQQEKMFVSAREFLDQARPRFDLAVKTFKTQIDAASKAPDDGAAAGKKTPRTPTRPRAARGPTAAEKARADLEFRWIETRFKTGLLDYWYAQSYLDAKAEPRDKAFKAAAKVFNSLFQDYRGERVGLVAHLWHGKILGEQGKWRDALDVCDEILAIAPDRVERGPRVAVDPDIQALLTDAFILRLQMLAKTKDEKTALDEATAWMKAYANLQNTSSIYQGVALEWVKLQMARLEKTPEAGRKALQKQILDTLTKISNVRSEYQPEAILLRRQFVASSGGAVKSEASTLEEALALANAAMQAQEWTNALDLYKQATDLLPKAKLTPAKRQEHLALIHERVGYIQYRLAAVQLDEKKYAEAADAAEKTALEYADTQAAPSAASIAIYAVQRLASDPAKKDADRAPILDRLVKLAEAVIKKWPDRAEADDARIALGQVSSFRGDSEKAIATFSMVNPKSSRYGTAMYNAGKLSWRLYLMERVKPPAKRDAKVMETTRQNAQKWFVISLDLQTKAQEAGKPVSEQLAETQLLLAEIYLEGATARGADNTAAGADKNAEKAANVAKAIALYRVLLDAATAANSGATKPATLDPTTLRIFNGAIKANVAAGNLAQATETGLALAQLGGDQPQINALVIDVAKHLIRDLAQAEAAEITASGGTDAAATEAAKARLADSKATLSKILVQLAPRQQMSLPTMMYIGDNCVRVGLKEESRSLYQRILDQAEKDEDYKKRAAPALTRIRAQLIGLLREENKFEEAAGEIEKLLDKHPKALDLLMQKGRILQSWAKTDPKQYPNAVAHWTRLRTMLQPLRQKPEEFFEVLYNTAECLVYESQATKSTKQAEQAYKLLKGELDIRPNLNGPEMVARYKVLMKKAAALLDAK